MMNRQSGAAHVPIMFFLLLMVLFLGTLGFAVVTNNENGQLKQARDSAQADLATLRQQALLVEHYIEETGRVINKPGKYEGKKNAGNVYGGATLTYSGVMNPDEIKKAMDDACAGAGVSVASGMENVLGAIVTKVKQGEDRVRDITAERDRALTEKAELDKKLQTVANESKTNASKYQSDNDQIRSDFAAANQERENRIAQVTESLRAKQEEWDGEKKKAEAVEKKLNQEKAELKNHNSALVARDELHQPPDSPDGKVLVAKQGIAVAYINLGRKDMLQPGTKFRVRTPNSTKVKGYATVKRVEDERAEVELSDFADPVGDFARDGDLIYNDIYTPRVTRTIYLMGSFTAPYNKPELTNLLKRLGNKVVDKMAPGVDTVILGNNPVNEAGDGFAKVQDSAEFKLASDLRVEFSYLAKIGDLIKL
jgi:hypothetical protein